MNSLKRLLHSILAVLFGLALGLGATGLAGENPWNVARILVHGAFGTREHLGWTLFYATPLIFSGLSVSIAFQAGLFNVGAEGQLTAGACAAAATGALWPALPSLLAPLLAGLAAVVAGAFWGGIAGWLRARRGSHEVVVTIMLNFIAAGLTTYVARYLLPNPDSQNPETRPIGSGYLIPHLWFFQLDALRHGRLAVDRAFFGDAPLSVAMPLGILTAGLVWLFLSRTALGFELRATGQGELAARAAGIDVARIRILAMVLAGAIAGMVGIGEVLGNAARFKVEFSPQYGFVGIAVALLGRNRPIGVLLAALLFGALHQGASELDIETEHVTHELSLVFQALIILAVSAEGLRAWVRRKPRLAGYEQRIVRGEG